MSVLYTLDLGNPAAIANYLALTETEIAEIHEQAKKFGNMSPAKAAGLAKVKRQNFADGPWQKQKDAVTAALGFYPFRGGLAPEAEMRIRQQIAADGYKHNGESLDYGQPWQRYVALAHYGYDFQPIDAPDANAEEITITEDFV